MTLSPRRRARLLAGLAGTAVLAASCRIPPVSLTEPAQPLPQNSIIFDADGRQITTLHAEENRILVPFERIPKVVRDAVVATEDRRFYHHRGVDLRALMRAAVANANEGRIVEGGSTITQQYAKNVYVGDEQTLRRKVAEARVALELEKRFTKDEILGRYLNTIYFGKGAYGIQAAARKYFSKNAWELQLSEATLLAGVIAAPERHDPVDLPEEARVRRDRVLQRMLDLKMIDRVAFDAAIAAPLGLRLAPEKRRYPAAYFVEYVKERILSDPQFGATERDRYDYLFKGGLRIHTTIDLDTQRAAEKAVEGILSQPGDPYGALTAIDPRSGEIKAMVGGRDFFAKPKKDPSAQVNLATGDGGTGRQAGSSFKPFALVAALEQGISPQKEYRGGSSITIPRGYGDPWTVENYEGSAYGDITLEEATINSVNVVYAQLIMEVGPQRVADVAHQMGIRSKIRSVPSAVLGSNEVNTLEMASAYGTLAAGGTHVEPTAITNITDASGRVLWEAQPFIDQVLNPGIAWVATQILRKVILQGTGIAANIGRPAAGKTGTAQQWRDAWFAGYIPQMAASVWVGFPQGQVSMTPPKTRIRVTGGSFPAQIWHAFMTAVTRDMPVKGFGKPEGSFVEITIDVGRGCAVVDPATAIGEVEVATFVRGTEPLPCPGEEFAPVEDVAPVDGRSVPPVIGLPAESAATTLEDVGFSVRQETEFHADYPDGTVIRQYPAGGTEAPPGSTVTLVVSTQQSQVVAVPNVVGVPEQEARAELEAAGFDVTIVYASKKKPGAGAGTVLSTEPKAGTKVPRGSTITITVNPG